MRQFGTLPNEEDARRLAGYLATQGIAVQVMPEQASWVLWVRDEDQLEQAREELARFHVQPQDARYQIADVQPQPARRRNPLRAATRSRGPRRASRFRRSNAARTRAAVALFLIAVSVTVTLGSWFGRVRSDALGYSAIRVLSFADIDAMMRADSKDPFFSLRSGQLWRLVTPIFLHFNWEHILFNMVMFYYLASQLERLQGPLKLGLIVLLLAVVSNVAQAYFEGPNFGGMSGVVYGLLGYIWMKVSYEPDLGYMLDPLMFVVALAWFFMCLFNFFEDQNVANYGHAGGLVSGIVIGIIPLLRRTAQESHADTGS
jgi:GlpG protein